ncbi:branched-chain amino acid ABC transporter permease [Pseudooceanicola aestuarii]|uniref:branched-chain amino acid ABC transporter permease n=1 Tax=Pseudooceanicola aestuarii TaxID=2697319 RepID=UPI001EF9B0EA|nr:branched-chain amino acid ABC transporter permease [Pseudooceanicola aestuarii]
MVTGNTSSTAAPSDPGTSHAGPGRRITLYLLGAVLLVLLLAPAFVKNFFVFQMTLWLIYAIAILGLNLLTGTSGQVSLGHSAFYAVGAYTAAILLDQTSIHYVLTLPVAALIGFGAGFLFGFPALRLTGVYLAMATFALAVATPPIIKLHVFEQWTGGVQGLFVDKPSAPMGLPISDDAWLYYLTLGVGVLVFLFGSSLLNSRTGRACLALRDNPIAASAMGVNVALYKTLIFGLSAAIASIAGALSAIAVQFVAVDSFTFQLAILLFVGMIVGGIGWLPGSLVGAAFVIFVPNIADGISQGLSGAVFGALLLLVIFVLPNGAQQIAAWLYTRLGGGKRAG